MTDVQKALEAAAAAVNRVQTCTDQNCVECSKERARAAVVAFLRTLPQFQGDPATSLPWLPAYILAAIEKEPQ